MKYYRTLVVLLCAVTMCGCQPPTPSASVSSTQGSLAPPPPPGQSVLETSTAGAQSALVAAYRAAHARQDVDAMLQLYCFDGVSSEMREIVRENVGAELRYPITSINIAPVPAGKYGPTVEGGIRWRPSLEVIALLTVNFDTSRAPPGEFATQQVELPVGQKATACYLTAPVRE